MKKVIKTLSLLLAIITVILTVSCGGDTEESVAVRVVGMTGPTSMGLAKLRDDAENGKTETKYSFELVATADMIVPKIAGNNPIYDIASVPVNIAVNLNRSSGGKVKIIAVNTLGVLYIVTKNAEITSLADLKGKTIYATGKSSMPEYTLKTLLKLNGISEDEVTIEWKSEPAEILPLLKQSESAVAMLPEPFVTSAKSKVEGLTVSLNLTEEWSKTGNGVPVTSVIIARSEFAENNPETIKAFLEDAEASVEYVNSHIEEAGDIIGKYGIADAEVAKKAIPACNIVLIKGDEMKIKLNAFLNAMYNTSPEAFGNILETDGLYYE